MNYVIMIDVTALKLLGEYQVCWYGMSGMLILPLWLTDFFNDGLLDIFLIDDESGNWTKDIGIWQGWVRMKNVEMEDDEHRWER